MADGPHVCVQRPNNGTSDAVGPSTPTVFLPSPFFVIARDAGTLAPLVTRIDALRLAVSATRSRTPFHIDAWVVLPDHMNRVWT